MANDRGCSDKNKNCRLGKVGGQAVLEGIMMKAGTHTVTTCRKENGELVVYNSEFVSVRKKHKFLNIPILRGVVNFIEMMALSMKTLSDSADALGIEEEEGKVEQWLKKHLGIGITSIIMGVALVLGLALALLLFMFVPNLVTSLVNEYIFSGRLGIWTAVFEGVLKVIIFLLYIWLVAFIPDIKRTFMYHGAEHKSIACFEAECELTPENARKYRRFHPRCGTSFMFFMILIGVIAGLVIKIILEKYNFLTGSNHTLQTLAYTGIRILVLPIVMGLGYEFIMFAGKHDNLFTRALSAPGLWVQRLTTKEPTDDMLEVAIISLKCALRDDFPEFNTFFLERPWEKKDQPADAQAEEDAAESDTEANSPERANLQEEAQTAEPTDSLQSQADANTAEAAEQDGAAAEENANEDNRGN